MQVHLKTGWENGTCVMVMTVMISLMTNASHEVSAQ